MGHALKGLEQYNDRLSTTRCLNTTRMYDFICGWIEGASSQSLPPSDHDVPIRLLSNYLQSVCTYVDFVTEMYTRIASTTFLMLVTLPHIPPSTTTSHDCSSALREAEFLSPAQIVLEEPSLVDPSRHSSPKKEVVAQRCLTVLPPPLQTPPLAPR